MYITVQEEQKTQVFFKKGQNQIFEYPYFQEKILKTKSG